LKLKIYKVYLNNDHAYFYDVLWLKIILSINGDGGEDFYVKIFLDQEVQKLIVYS
jgi:hypothetical protein